MKTNYMFVVAAAMVLFTACGPAKMPKGGFQDAPSLLVEQEKLREKVRSFRITGRVDHFGEMRVQGKVFIFAELPDKLRIELLSPFNSTLATLTVNGNDFALHDQREGRFLYGPAEPCNIAKLVNIPLPPEEVIAILRGSTPTIEGEERIRWSEKGYYVVEIAQEHAMQRLNIGPSEKTLPLKKSVLKMGDASIFDITYDRWMRIDEMGIPHEIRAKMPAHDTDLLIRYDQGGVELNVDLPSDGWNQTPPPGMEAEEVLCQ